MPLSAKYEIFCINWQLFISTLNSLQICTNVQIVTNMPVVEKVGKSEGRKYSDIFSVNFYFISSNKLQCIP